MTERPTRRRRVALTRASEYSKDDRLRLGFISSQIGKRMPVDEAHLPWLNEILIAILSGVDLRPRFAEPKQGRPVEKRPIHAAIDFRLRLEREPKSSREDVAWQVAQDWGYDDGATILKYERRARRLCDMIVYNIEINPAQGAAWQEILKESRSSKGKRRNSP